MWLQPISQVDLQGIDAANKITADADWRGMLGYRVMNATPAFFRLTDDSGVLIVEVPAWTIAGGTWDRPTQAIHLAADYQWPTTRDQAIPATQYNLLVEVTPEVVPDGFQTLPISGGSTQGELVDASGAIAAGGVAQQLVPQDLLRRYLIVQNLSTESLWINPNGDATAGEGSIELVQSASIVWEGSIVPTNAFSILGATTGDKYTCKVG